MRLVLALCLVHWSLALASPTTDMSGELVQRWVGDREHPLTSVEDFLEVQKSACGPLTSEAAKGGPS